MKSSNPFIKTKNYQKAVTTSGGEGVIERFNSSSGTMTLNGTMNKSLMLLFLVVISSSVTWLAIAGEPGLMFPAMIVGGIGSFVIALISAFKPRLSKYFAVAYSLVEGLFVGGLSLYAESMFPGIVMQAVVGMLVTFVVMFLLYRYRIIKVTERFRSVIIGATIGIAVFYLMNIGLYFIFDKIPVSWGSSWMSIGISAFVIVIAAFNLMLDFDQIEEGIEMESPKYMEWYSAMGLVITLVWLYIEILRLLIKLQSRD